MIKETHDCSPQAYKLVAAAKSALPRITDPNQKSQLRQAADEAAEALQKLVGANKAVVVSIGQADVDQAMEIFAAEEANLDYVIVDVDSGNFRPDFNQSPEGASQLLNIAAKEVASAVKRMATTAKTNPDDFGPAAKGLADAITQANTAAKVLASTTPDRFTQREILEAAKGLTREGRNALSSARAVASNPSDANLNSLLAESARNLAEALSKLLASSKGSTSAAKDVDEAVASITASIRQLGLASAQSGTSNKDFSRLAEDLGK